MKINKYSIVNTFFVSAIMMVIFLCCCSQAQAAPEDDYDFTVTNGQATIIRYSGPGGNVTIPSKLDGYPVTSIYRSAFSNCKSLTSVSIPQGITSIGAGAFSSCIYLTNISVDIDNLTYKSINGVLYNKAGTILVVCPGGLTSVSLPQGIKSIGDNAFQGCTSLTSISLPQGVTSIGEKVFYGCIALTSISLPQGLTSIGSSAFEDCKNLKSISIPQGVTSIGDWAFDDCTSLTSINIPQGVTSIGKKVFYYCTSLTNISIPQGVTSIGEDAFYYCTSLTSISLPQELTSIGSSAFKNCKSLKSINLPRGLTSIGAGAFSSCISLTNISVDTNNLTYKSINGVLYNKAGTILLVCPGGLTSISLPQGVTHIGDLAFLTCKNLKSISLPQGVTSIGDWAFDDCSNLTSISLPQGLASIGKYAFCNCRSLTSISLPQGVTSIGEGAFYYCRSLTSISLPQEVTSIRKSTFLSCESLKSISLPQGLTSIGDWAFNDCESLTSISLPQGVTNIGELAFDHCTSLTSIDLPQGLVSIGKYAFDDCIKMATIRFNSPTTTIFDEYNTIPGPTKIIGYDPSTAKDYAEKYSRTFEVISTTNPKVTSTDPADNATNIPVNKVIKVTFSCNVQSGSNFGNITLKNAGGTTIATTNNISSGTNYLTIKPQADLTGNAKYTVNIPAGAVKDMSGTSLANTYNFSFTTASAAPKVINYSPADDATGVALNSKLVLTFDQNVSAVKGKNIYIKKTANDNQVSCIPVTDKNRVNISGAKVTINPCSNFRPNTGYYILIDSGAFKNSNNGLFAGINNKTIWNFTTIDTIPPAVSSTDPANNSTKVAVNKTIKVTFSENVLKGNTFSNITLKNAGGTTIVTTNTISANTNYLTIKPQANLAGNVKYTVNIPAGAVKDMTGNSLANTYNFSFTTALAAPKIIKFSPADNATGVALNSKLVLTFDQNVSAVKGKNIYIKKTANDNQVCCIPVTDKNRVNISGAKVTINPSSNFRSNIGYYILIDSGAFKNSNNGLFAGINNKTTWNFTTIDTIPPAVSSTDPANNSTKVAVNKTIKVTFSENVLKGNTFGNITLKNISNGKTIKITTSIKDNVLTIQPSDNLKHNKKYKVIIPASAIKDTSGSILAADYTFSFTTIKKKK